MLQKAIRAYRRWQYLRAPRPTFVATVTPVDRHWTATDERLERDLYLANPNAFWLRPDRHKHQIPCWQIEGVWEAPPRIEWVNNYAASGIHNSAAAAMHGAMATQYEANMRAHSQLGLSQYQRLNSLESQLSRQREDLYGIGQLLGKPFGY